MNNGKYKYWLKDENLAKVTKWAKEGLFDCQIAEKMGISKQTFYDWFKKYPEFTDAIKKGQKVVIVDDLIATGGTVEAAIKLIERLGGEVVACVFLTELVNLKGRDVLEGYRVESIVKFDGK